MAVKVAILGLGTAGITFITEMRRIRANLKCDITLFEKRGAKIFHPCSIPEALEGKINTENLIEPMNLKDIKVVQSEVLEVDPEKREISFLKDGRVEKMSFDFIFIATGGETPIPKDQKFSNKVFKATKYEDVVEINKRLQNAKNISIIGAGILGIELASALSSHAEVEVFEMGDQILPKFLKKDLSQKLFEYIQKRVVEEKRYPVKFHFGQKVENPQNLDSDFVIFSVGFIPNNPLPHKIKVDEYMRVKNERDNSSYDYIFAAGDCIEDFDIPRVAPIAAEQARVAARNMWAIIQGKEPSEKYEKMVAPCLIKAFGFEIGKVAIINKPEKTSTFTLDLKVLPFSDDDRIVVSVEVDDEGKIVDVQGFSNLRSEIRHLLDIFYICIKKKIRIDEIRRFELSYQPEVCKFPDPITSIAEFVSRRLNFQ